MSRFHKYSVNNTMLIYMQKPNAALVAGFNKWRDQFERNVMRGEVYYARCYNNRRIKAKLKGLPPAIHRQQALAAA